MHENGNHEHHYLATCNSLYPYIRATSPGPSTAKRPAAEMIFVRRRHRMSAYTSLFPEKISSSGTRATFSCMNEKRNVCSYFPLTFETPSNVFSIDALVMVDCTGRAGERNPDTQRGNALELSTSRPATR